MRLGRDVYSRKLSNDRSTKSASTNYLRGQSRHGSHIAVATHLSDPNIQDERQFLVLEYLAHNGERKYTCEEFQFPEYFAQNEEGK